MEYSIWGWAGFVAFLMMMLALDLGVFHRRSHVVGFREAVVWSCVWAAMALGFGWILLVRSDPETATGFVTAWLIEKSLSVDNVFVFALLFTSMRVPRQCEHKVLFWGVFGALLMRVVMIFCGIALMERFEWLIYLFGGYLLVVSIRMLLPVSDKSRQQEHLLMRLSRRYLRLTPDYEGDRFFVRRNHVLYATPLFVVLLVVEWSDLVFAVDSIPAVLAVSRDPFIVFTSNAFAILGLRSLYFALAGMMDRFQLLHYGLAAILGFVGLKMILADVYHIPVMVSLCVILSILTLSVLLSLGRPCRVTSTDRRDCSEQAAAGSGYDANDCDIRDRSHGQSDQPIRHSEESPPIWLPQRTRSLNVHSQHGTVKQLDSQGRSFLNEFRPSNQLTEREHEWRQTRAERRQPPTI